MAGNKKFLKLLNYIPQHMLSHLAGWFAKQQWGWLKNILIKLFIHYYAVDMKDAEYQDYRNYSSFNAFFTRHLKPNARPFGTADKHRVISPCDGSISELGYLKSDSILQAKGRNYTVKSLLGPIGDGLDSKRFTNGSFLTIYLSPKDYHRFHMPLSGKLLGMRYIPGNLFCVNPTAVNHVPDLFTRNERVVSLFETPCGQVGIIAVGAMLVGSIVTKWHGVVVPAKINQIKTWTYEKNIFLSQGDEIGYFKMGSTIIVLFPEKSIQWLPTLGANSTLKVGEPIGSLKF